jgi:hypothetical protein
MESNQVHLEGVEYLNVETIMRGIPCMVVIDEEDNRITVYEDEVVVFDREYQVTRRSK